MVPREHGFWVMLLAVLVSAVWRGAFRLEVVLVALATAVVVAVLGGASARYLRRHAWAQVLVGLPLGFLGAPAELLAGIALYEVLVRAVAWGVIFATGALAVRAVFEPPGSRRRALTLLSIALPLATSGALFFGARVEALGTALAAFTAALIAALSPSTKQLRTVGLALGALTGIVTLLLNLRAG